MDKAEYTYHRQTTTLLENILSRVRFPQSRPILDIFIKKSIYLAQGIVADIGCGLGENDIYLASNMERQIVGIDVDKSALSLAQSALRSIKGTRYIHYVLASATDLPFCQKCAESAVSFQVLEHLEDPTIGLCEINRVLKSTGKLLISTPVTSHAPLSINHFESRFLGRLTLDIYSGHLHRFVPTWLAKRIIACGFNIDYLRFASQYVPPLFGYVISLRSRHVVRKRKEPPDMKYDLLAQVLSFWLTLKDSTIMLFSVLESTIFARCPFGSDIIVIATKTRETS